jgi:hypothetical protein
MSFGRISTRSAPIGRQPDRHATYHYGVDGMDILRNFLPEWPKAQSDALAALRREPERRVPWWRRLRARLINLWND